MSNLELQDREREFRAAAIMEQDSVWNRVVRSRSATHLTNSFSILPVVCIFRIHPV
jgi:hypothetical protein